MGVFLSRDKSIEGNKIAERFRKEASLKGLSNQAVKLSKEFRENFILNMIYKHCKIN